MIRPASVTDIPELSDFASRTFYQAYGWYNTEKNMREYVEKYFSINQLKEELSDESIIYLIEENQGKIEGYLKLGRKNKPPGINHVSCSEIERIYVDEYLQRKGTGKKLLNAAIRIVSERKDEILWLGVWQKNEKAIAFYLKNGFKITGTTKFILGDDEQDDFIMMLDLSSVNQ